MTLADDRLEDDQDDVDDAAALARRLEVAQEFDDAEARALEERPEPLVGVSKKNGHQYGVEGETPSEWLTTNYVVPVGFDGGDQA